MADAPTAWRRYLELATGLGEMSRKQVRKVVKDLVGKGNATADQLKAISTELVAAATSNREALAKLVRVEIDRALGKVGLATMEEVNELTARVRQLEKELREARMAAAQPTVIEAVNGVEAVPPAKAVKATKAVKAAKAVRATKAAPAEAVPAKKTVAKKTTAKKAAKRVAGMRTEAGR